MKTPSLFIMLAAILIAIAGRAQNIYTYAGSGVTYYAGDGGQALQAELYAPTGIAVDASGNLYIADANNHRIRKVSSAGVITTIAGTGTAGFSGDNGPAIAAKLNHPEGISVDASGRIYIADTYNNRIRMIDAGGNITTIAGTGVAGYNGNGTPATQANINGPTCVLIDAAGNLFFADSYNNAVRKIDPSGIIGQVAGTGTGGFSGDGGAATSAQLLQPYALALDASGNIYITDTGNNRIRKVNTSGVISTVAGTGLSSPPNNNGPALQAGLANPAGIARDALGNLYISELMSHSIRKINSAGTITAVAGTGTAAFAGDGGPADSARLSSPHALVADAQGNLWIADTGNNRIRKIGASDTIATVAGAGTSSFAGDGGPALGAQFNKPSGMALDKSGSLYIADAANHRIRKITQAGTVSTVAGSGLQGFSGDGGSALAASLNQPSSIAFDSTGNLYVADAGNNRIRKIDTSGAITTVAGNGMAGYAGDGGPAVSARLNFPAGIAADKSGNIFIADTYNNRVRYVESSSGHISNVAGNGYFGYLGDGIGAGYAQMKHPLGVALDTSGNIYITDTGNNCVRQVRSNGFIYTIAGTGGSFGFMGDGGAATDALLDQPATTMVDQAGNLYIADAGNNRVRVVNTSGTINTIAGSSLAGMFGGDGGPAIQAKLNQPYATALDAGGNLYISDRDNQRIRILCAIGCIQGVENINPSSLSVLAYPNPNSGSFRVDIDQQLNGGSLLIYDTFGQAVHRQAVSGGSNQVTLSALAPGIYYYNILEGSRKLATGKLIIE